jgi:glutamine amidotransferase
MHEMNLGIVAIVDYEAGNLFSVEHACKTVGLTPVITSKPEDILQSDALILPGVGAFGDAMNNLRKLDLIQPLLEFAASGKPFMGICLGMQSMRD